ncbi:5'-3' exoribonuclease 2 [Euphorbia peplus]|nr:5'-3' exoribonuclease 2 [Euphorbia peplus]
MGVPAFYMWLLNKYPKIVSHAQQSNSIHNPNGMEFDNLYLDMNGIIHPCFHPDDHHHSPPTTFEEVFINIYEYIDHIFRIVRPRNILYLAIDGVAPRAKMNQQRSRRFRAAKDMEISEEEEQVLRKEFERLDKQVLPKQDTEVSDSNMITPGTEFMFLLSRKLQDYISSRISCDPGWKKIKVILSDANVPGEGEHKIMSFIRQQRTVDGYNPNTRHCLYGLDADLIMLALATHELHFSILREEVLSVPEPQSICFSDLEMSSGRVTKRSWFTRKPYQFLHLWILREYLEIDLEITDAPEKFSFDIERVIDDFVFMCFFVGNDFLPCMPTLQIREQAIDLLMTVYKTKFKNLGGYLVDTQRVNDPKHSYFKLKRVEKFILLIGSYEDMIFKKRSELYQQKLRKLCINSDALEEDPSELDANLEFNTSNGSFAPVDEKAHASEDMILQNTKELKAKLKARLRNKSDLFQHGGLGSDNVKLGTADWKRRYYKEKFVAADVESKREEIVQKYTEGLHWVLLYYFSEVPSWTWFYPYHYAPFASDMKGLTRVKVKFHKSSPFKPFDQLMAVLPPRSSQFLPEAYRKLMTDKNSNIIKFYPDELDVDTDGKRFIWQAICKLPFIDEELLLGETRNLGKEIEEWEAQRNMESIDKIFMRRSDMPDSQLLPLVSNLASGRPKYMMKMENGGIGGLMRLLLEEIGDIGLTFESLWKYIMDKDVLILLFELQKGSPHVPRPLPGVEYPQKCISENEIEETPLWHEYPGPRCPTRTRLQVQKSHGNTRHSAAESGLNLTSHKGAGIGWGTGRGSGTRTGFTSNNIPRNAVPSRNTNQNFNRGKGVHNGLKSQRGDLVHNNSWQSRNSIASNTNNFWRRSEDKGQ